MRLLAMAAGLASLAGPALASGTGEAIRSAAYEGTLTSQSAALGNQCDADDAEACFGAGLAELIGAYEGLAQGVYRHGAVVPGTSGAAMLLGFSDGLTEPVPANPTPEPLSYAELRDILNGFVTGLDAARDRFEQAGADGDYVLRLDPLQVPFDLDGNGEIATGETLAPLFWTLFGDSANPPAAAGAPDFVIGFDRADAFWLAGYSQVVASPVDFVLAHDFSSFFNAYLHRVFPRAGLPMQDFVTSPEPSEPEDFLDANTAPAIADMIAGLHTLDWPVVDAARLAGVRTRLKAVTGYSRANWAAILEETDDTRELLPSPRQTPLFPEAVVTQAHFEAWLQTLDSVDKVLDGALLLPHWRFKQGVDLKAYFETASETDLVMLLSGFDALAYLRDGPIADADDFAPANDVFGDALFPYAIWFN
ncbi:hypothetical protein [Devosia sp.]|uniref:hypothetical protein n=1 Tax=Devosia sp. TaxID=1871048 RepID=UPI003A957A0D